MFRRSHNATVLQSGTCLLEFEHKRQVPPLLFAKLIWKVKTTTTTAAAKQEQNKNKNKNKLMETYLHRVCSIYNRKKNLNFAIA